VLRSVSARGNHGGAGSALLGPSVRWARYMAAQNAVLIERATAKPACCAPIRIGIADTLRTPFSASLP
jgi:hypothetical protein